MEIQNGWGGELSFPGYFTTISPVLSQSLVLHSSNASTGKAGEVWKDRKTETPGDTMEIIRSHTTVLQPWFPATLAHRQPKPGLLQTVRGAKQWLCWTHPLASTLHNPLHMYTPTQSNCEIWVHKGGEFEALKYVFRCIASLHMYFMGVSWLILCTDFSLWDSLVLEGSHFLVCIVSGVRLNVLVVCHCSDWCSLGGPSARHKPHSFI